MPIKEISRQQVIDAVNTLPDDRLQSLYDYTLFLQIQSMPPTPETDLFGESAAEIEADEAIWEEQYSASRTNLRQMAREAAIAYRTGVAKPMRFSEDGRLVE